MTDTVYPVAKWEGRTPVISSGFRTGGRPDHDGADIMFARTPADTARFPVGSPEGSKLFVMPSGVDVVAWRAGKLWSAAKTDKGYSVVIDHGRPYSSFYLHLETLAIPTRKAGAGGPVIEAGQVLGTVGFSPLDAAKLRHLHFEIWENGGGEAAVDPAPLLVGARYVDNGSRWKRLALLVGGLLALFGLSKRGGRGMPVS